MFILMCLVLMALMTFPSISVADKIDVQKGADDGVMTTKHQDYKEAVLFPNMK